MPTDLGALVAPTYLELTSGIGKRLHAMERVNDPIAIHYSQPSITAHWMLEHRPLGEGWVEKRSWHERRESGFTDIYWTTQAEVAKSGCGVDGGLTT